MTNTKAFGKKFEKLWRDCCCMAAETAARQSSIALFMLGTFFLIGGLIELASAQAVADASAVAACTRLLSYMEGGFGALVAAAAGVGAIVAAAVGGFRAAWSLLVVSIGSFILRAYITLFNKGC